ncbi:LOW QUALITY PROTEIN: receptor-like protein 7 [Cicer arietinum]|uniref:LOW QUALITY PROTEIN: receptor-like protein 7 n=1 Tax=Cicer arietinum TaxID=3827 RepID=UPI003CC6998D
MSWLLLYLNILLFYFPLFSSSFNFLCHYEESYALLQFKSSFSIDMSSYYYCSDASLPKTVTWKNGTDCCSWNGVTCDISGHVIDLNLGCEGLKGIIHRNSTIFNLAHLEMLNLSNNYFSDSHFHSKFGGFMSLTHLDLSYNEFQGEVPPQISHLSELTSLHLSSNDELVWKETTLKRLVQNATNLRELILDYTNMSSIRLNTIDMIFNQSSSLVTLNLRSTGLRGNFKNKILCLPHIQHLIHLDLSYNSFSSKISYVFGGMIKLQELDLSSNNLQGQIPSLLFNLTQLVKLDCSSNKLEGPLPNKITGFQKLTDLMLYDNMINGTIPSWCLSLPSLVNLYLASNQLTELPSEISSHSLKVLYLSDNILQGNIPESIFNLANLTKLYLSSNNFSGLVNFQHFSKLQNLEVLHLSDNSQLSLNFESEANYNFSKLFVLDLSSMSLTQFPKLLLRNYNRLDYLDLSNNKLNGRVSNWLLESSIRLNLSQNLFTAIDLSMSIQLELLDLSFNLLDGDLSSLSFCNMTSLEFLNFANNKLTGIIPQCLANISSLRNLDLQMNNFYGALPSKFSKDSNLQTLNLNDNQLEGHLPKSLSNCGGLQVLNIGNNKIQDNFPDWLHTLPFLTVLILRDNKFHGSIANLNIKRPFPSLVIFDTSGNNLTGLLPKYFFKNFEAMKYIVTLVVTKYYTSSLYIDASIFHDLVSVVTKGITMKLVKIPMNFVSIDLSRNKFEGEIPNVIGDLHGLIVLNLSYNRLTGPIPRSIANLTNLESLDLSSNRLTSVIPPQLTNVYSLEVLNLSNNHLVGEIPQGKQFNTFSNDSYEGNLGLCGFPLTMKCGPQQNSPASTKFWSEEKFGFGWKPVAIGYGCGVVFGICLGSFIFLMGQPRWFVMLFGGQPKRRVKRRTRVTRSHATTIHQMIQMS